MRFYGMTYWEVLDTPIAAFWMLHRNIDRLRAEEDLRRLENTMMAHAGSKEGLEKYRTKLLGEIGVVFVEKPVFDREGLKSLKELNKAK